MTGAVKFGVRELALAFRGRGSPRPIRPPGEPGGNKAAEGRPAAPLRTSRTPYEAKKKPWAPKPALWRRRQPATFAKSRIELTYSQRRTYENSDRNKIGVFEIRTNATADPSPPSADGAAGFGMTAGGKERAKEPAGGNAEACAGETAQVEGDVDGRVYGGVSRYQSSRRKPRGKPRPSERKGPTPPSRISPTGYGARVRHAPRAKMELPLLLLKIFQRHTFPIQTIGTQRPRQGSAYSAFRLAGNP
jgi:hypothetical protein